MTTKAKVPWIEDDLLALTAMGAGFWAGGKEMAGAPLWLAAALILAGWVPLWEALTTTDWASALASWRRWRTVPPAPRLPYLRRGAPGNRLTGAAAAASAWWRAQGGEQVGAALRQSFLAVLVGLVIAAATGQGVLLLTLLFWAVAEFATLWHDGKGVDSAFWSALGTVGLPWLLGMSLGPVSGAAAAGAALAVTLIATAFFSPHPAALAALLPGSAYLLWQGHPLLTAWVLLAAYPPLRYAAIPLPPARHRELAFPWLLLVLLLLAGA